MDILHHDEHIQQPSLLYCTHFFTTVIRMTNMLKAWLLCDGVSPSSRQKLELASFELDKSSPELRRYIMSFLLQTKQQVTHHRDSPLSCATQHIEEESTWWSSTSKAFVTGCCLYYSSPQTYKRSFETVVNVDESNEGFRISIHPISIIRRVVTAAQTSPPCKPVTTVQTEVSATSKFATLYTLWPM